MPTTQTTNTPRSGFWQGWKNEPARLFALVAAVLQLVVSFGFLDLTRDQIEMVLGLVALTIGAGEMTRRNAYPAHKVRETVSEKTLEKLDKGVSNE